uniref:Uncharacterized protein n=1 Tax=Anguilla anguilla TaxID=7936 RepID=A0A0E9PYV9_ANGAN
MGETPKRFLYREIAVPPHQLAKPHAISHRGLLKGQWST